MSKDQSDLTESTHKQFMDKMQLLWIALLAGGKELISVWSGHKPQCDDCEAKTQAEILEQGLKQMGDKKNLWRDRKRHRPLRGGPCGTDSQNVP